MPAGVTYSTIATTTITAQTSYTFSSIPSTYTDLIIIAVAKNSNTGSVANNYRIRFNGDTGTNYSDTFISGNGSTASSFRDSNQPELYWGQLNNTELQPCTSIAHIMNYANTTTNKTLLARGGSAEVSVNANVGLWRNTSAINSIQIYAGGTTTFTGTLTLYGITAA
jgi:hypothetical protein